MRMHVVIQRGKVQCRTLIDHYPCSPLLAHTNAAAYHSFTLAGSPQPTLTKAAFVVSTQPATVTLALRTPPCAARSACMALARAGAALQSPWMPRVTEKDTVWSSAPSCEWAATNTGVLTCLLPALVLCVDSSALCGRLGGFPRP